MLLTRTTLLGLAIALLSVTPGVTEYRETAVGNGGSVEGRVYFDGDYPPPESYRPSRDAGTCGVRVPSEKFVVDGDSKGLANAIVRLEGVSSGKAFPSADGVISQLECRYRPHILVQQPGEDLKIVNQDPILHNVHAYREDETLFNMAQPFQGQETRQPLDDEGLVRIACDVHDWMEAWVLVIDNPYFAITDEQGQFSISAVPPGRYQITMWQEMLGTATKTVEVTAGAAASIDFAIGK